MVQERARGGLGSLERLPSETRCLVWQYAFVGADITGNRRNLLVSHQFYDEAIAEIFRNRSIHFLLRPLPVQISGSGGPRCPSQMHVVDSCYYVPLIAPRFLAFDTFLSQRQCFDWVHQPLGSKSIVTVNIRPPSASDRGELVMAFYKIIWIVNFLQCAGSIPRLLIRFLGAHGDWGVTQRDGVSGTGFTTRPYPSVEVLLLTFCRLRQVRDLHLQLDRPQEKGVKKMI